MIEAEYTGLAKALAQANPGEPCIHEQAAKVWSDCVRRIADVLRYHNPGLDIAEFIETCKSE